MRIIINDSSALIDLAKTRLLDFSHQICIGGNIDKSVIAFNV